MTLLKKLPIADSGIFQVERRNPPIPASAIMDLTTGRTIVRETAEELEPILPEKEKRLSLASDFLQDGIEKLRNSHRGEIDYDNPPLLMDQVKIAQQIYYKAAAALGPDLQGWSLKDLIADNTDWSLRNIDDVMALMGSNILKHFKKNPPKKIPIMGNPPFELKKLSPTSTIENIDDIRYELKRDINSLKLLLQDKKDGYAVSENLIKQKRRNVKFLTKLLEDASKGKIIYNNPPREKVLIYSDCLEIRAKKSDGRLYKHKFTPGARIYGLPDGSLHIVSSKGKRLHKMFPKGDK